MKAFFALMRREAIEHRGPFFYAPLLVFGVLTLMVIGALFTSSSRFEFWVTARERLSELTGVLADSGGATAEQLQRLFGMVYTIGYGGAGYLWWAFLLIGLFFYCADAFNADRRNNAMLFWKSMPQSDLKILGSKLGAAMLLFPAMIFVAVLASGFVVFGGIAAAAQVNPLVLLPQAVDTYVQVTLGQIGWFVLGILWYAPWFAWVGLLSTMVGRWSIPLAFLVPALLVLLENLLLDDVPGARWGYVAQYLQQRFTFGLDEAQSARLVLGAEGPERFDGIAFVGQLAANIDWPQMAIGIAFAAAALYAASEYRRRVLAAG